MKTKPLISGFSAIEIVILVVVFAILAGVVVPKFSQAQSESKLTEMVSALQMMRSQIELYQIQHDDLLPGQTRPEGMVSPELFIDALLTKSKIDGFGPYIRQVPANPFVEAPYADQILFVKSDHDYPRISKYHGWCFNTVTGEFHACDRQEHTRY